MVGVPKSVPMVGVPKGVPMVGYTQGSLKGGLYPGFFQKIPPVTPWGISACYTLGYPRLLHLRVLITGLYLRVLITGLYLRVVYARLWAHRSVPRGTF